MSVASTPARRPQNEGIILRLTALWSLAESGLGGVLFALKIPLTGFLIGAISVVLLSLIARFSNYSARQILQATVVVLLVKVTVSPHSPPAAYLAVSFQGALAALLFATLRGSRIAPLLLGALSMAESALQKMVVLTLLFGKSLWEAVNKLGKEIAENFSFHTTSSNYALWLIGVYTTLYALWGMAVGTFAARLPAYMEARRESILQAFCNRSPPVLPTAGTRRKRSWIIYCATLLFILVVFLSSRVAKGKLVAVFLRSLAVTLLLLLGQPLLKGLLQWWLRRRSDATKARSKEVLQWLPTLRSYVPAAYGAAQVERGVLRKMRVFLLVMIVLTLYAETESQHPHPERIHPLRENDAVA